MTLCYADKSQRRWDRLSVDVTAARHLRAARPLVADLDFNVVLLDLNLPDGLGPELLRAQSLVCLR